MLGEVTAVTGCRSDETIICKNYCKIAMLVKQNFDLICKEYDDLELREKMQKLINKKINSPVNSFFMTHYGRTNVLKSLSKANARKMSYFWYLNAY